jgi:predicted AAA+ superfamily ATPase
MTTLQDLTGLVVIDEIQRRSEIFPILGVLADRKSLPTDFLVLGSAPAVSHRQSSERLADLISTGTVSDFSLEEVGAQAENMLRWCRGFPLSFSAPSEETSLDWRRDFLPTFLQRDIRQFVFNIFPTSLFRFWSLLVRFHGQVWNAAEAARILNISESTTRRWAHMTKQAMHAQHQKGFP